MEYSILGGSGVKVSKICVGGMSFGDPASKMHAWTLDAAGTETIVKRALDLGINFFDTANCYSAGTSEEYLNKALWKHVSREKIVLASKVFFNEGGLSRAAVLREIDGSLVRLGTDYLDLYIIHRFDYSTPIEETMTVLDSLVKAGKVRALGASAMYAHQFQAMQEFARGNGLTEFVSMQNHYNLLNREEERAMIPFCQKTGVALTPYSPLAAGRLCRPDWSAGTFRGRTDKVARAKYDGTEAADSKITRRVNEIAQKHNATMTQVSLAWLFAKGVCSAIVGATKAEHFEDAAGTFGVKLDAGDIAALEEFYTVHEPAGILKPPV